jgi:hypothetical protein
METFTNEAIENKSFNELSNEIKDQMTKMLELAGFDQWEIVGIMDGFKWDSRRVTSGLDGMYAYATLSHIWELCAYKVYTKGKNIPFYFDAGFKYLILSDEAIKTFLDRYELTETSFVTRNYAENDRMIYKVLHNVDKNICINFLVDSQKRKTSKSKWKTYNSYTDEFGKNGYCSIVVQHSEIGFEVVRELLTLSHSNYDNVEIFFNGLGGLTFKQLLKYDFFK